MSAKDDAAAWAAIAREVAEARGARYEEVGGLNPRGAPAALCPGGTNRITGELAEGFWGASCDALEHEEGGLFSKAVLPAAVLVKAHTPELAAEVPQLNVESLEAGSDALDRHSRRRVQFESIEFNRRFIATVPEDADPAAVRELFSPAFLDWAAGIDRQVDFGIAERQLYFMWRLRERSTAEYEAALVAAAEMFRRAQKELAETGTRPYAPGPWHAGLEPFPGSAQSDG